MARREASRATVSGPRNSRVTARPRPILATAAYSDRFIVAKINASARTGRHCPRVNEANLGRAAASRRTPAAHWRTATTPAGPSAGKASAAVAAPSWLDAALPVISAMPVSRSGCPVVAAPAGADCGCSQIERVMAGAWATATDTQNAWIKAAIRFSYGSGATASSLPGHDRGHGNVHRRRDRAGHLAGRRVAQPHGPRTGARCPATAPHQPEHHADHGRRAHPGPGT